MPDREALLALWLAGGLDAAGEGELAAALRDDPGWCGEALGELRLHALLCTALAPGAEVVVTGVRRRLAARDDATGFIARLRPRLAPRRRPSVRLALAAAAVLLAALGVWLAAPSPDRPAADGAPVAAGEHRFSADGAWTWSDGTSLRFAAGSRAALPAAAGPGRSVRLDAGVLTAEVAPQPADRPLLILCPGCEVVVLGTTFSVAVSDAVVDIAVTTGRVAVRHAGGEEEVAAGGRAQVRHPGGLALRRDAHDPVLWLDPGSGIEHSAGAVAAWRDRCGGLQARPLPGLPAPVLVADAFAGRPAVRFAGSPLEFAERDRLGGLGQGSIAAWVRPARLPGTGFAAIFAADHGINLGPFEFGITAGSLCIWTSDRPVDVYAQPPQEGVHLQGGALTVGAWRHLAYVAGDGPPRLYLDGSAVEVERAGRGLDFAPFLAFAAAPGTAYRVGATMDGEHLHGDLADLRIWDRPLDAAEVRALATPP